MLNIELGSQIVYQQTTVSFSRFEQITDLCQTQGNDQNLVLAV